MVLSYSGSKRFRQNGKQCRCSLIWVYTVCLDLSVQKLRIIMAGLWFIVTSERLEVNIRTKPVNAGLQGQHHSCLFLFFCKFCGNRSATIHICTAMILSFWTDRSWQTVQTQIRLLEQSDQSSSLIRVCLQCRLHPLDAILYIKAHLVQILG